MANPSIGSLLPRTGGLRKVRAVPDSWNSGKRGGLRICYVFLADVFIIVLAAAYSKKRKDDLSEEERAQMRKLIPAIKAEFSRERMKRE
jgi:hypothetical protein